MSGEDYVGEVSGWTVFDQVLTDRLVSTLARRNTSTCQHAVGTLLSWPDVRSRDIWSRDADSDHVTLVSGSRCLRPGV